MPKKDGTPTKREAALAEKAASESRMFAIRTLEKAIKQTEEGIENNKLHLEKYREQIRLLTK